MPGPRIILDAGHGGPPKRGLFWGASGHGINEKDWVLDLALEMKHVAPNNVKLTRSSDVNMTLGRRCDIANSLNGDFYLSLHLNGYGDPKARGFETFYNTGSSKGRSLARKVHAGVLGVLPSGMPDRKVKSTRQMTVLKRTRMPAILIEFGFVTNPEDAAFLKLPQTKTTLAMAILNALDVPLEGNEEPIPSLPAIIDQPPNLQDSITSIEQYLASASKELEEMKRILT